MPKAAGACYASTRLATVEKIEGKANGDLPRHMQLAEAVKRRLSPANFEPDKDLSRLRSPRASARE